MRNLLITITAALMLVSFAACNKDNTVKSDPDYIVLKRGESIKVELVGQHLQNHKSGIILNNADSIFLISEIKRRSLVVTGKNIGIDTLFLAYIQGGYNSGAYLEVPVTVVE